MEPVIIYEEYPAIITKITADTFKITMKLLA
jgi:hypothetical protein